MEIKTIKKDPARPFLGKLMAILFGIFITSILFALLLKTLDIKGLWLGLTLCAILIFCGFYYVNKGNVFRLMIWGMTGTILIVAVIYFIGLYVISNFTQL